MKHVERNMHIYIAAHSTGVLLSIRASFTAEYVCMSVFVSFQFTPLFHLDFHVWQSRPIASENRVNHIERNFPIIIRYVCNLICYISNALNSGSDYDHLGFFRILFSIFKIIHIFPWNYFFLSRGFRFISQNFNLFFVQIFAENFVVHASNKQTLTIYHLVIYVVLGKRWTSGCKNVNRVTLGNHLILTKCQISEELTRAYERVIATTTTETNKRDTCIIRSKCLCAKRS